MAASPATILVTGATGFVGGHLCRLLLERGHRVRGALRRRPARGTLIEDVEPVLVGEIGADTDWADALRGVDCVVHLAARVHVLREVDVDPVAAFRRDNVQATDRLARAAATAGVRRLVFASSARVNGPSSGAAPFRETDVPAPAEPYEHSKLEAERALADVAAATGLECTILRAPLVYGAGVKANFLSLMRALDRGLPLPLGAIRNHRSLIYAGNLASALTAACEHPAAAGRTFLVSDGEDVSTPELARRIAAALGRRARLPGIPVGLLRMAGRLVGREGAVERLCASLQVDSSAIREALGWRPPHTMVRGLEQTARWYRLGAPS